MRVARLLAIRSISGWITVLALMILVLFGFSFITYQHELSKYAQQSEIRLELFITYLQGVLEKYQSLPELLARDKRLVGFLTKPGDRDRIEAFNRYLETINDVSNAADTYLMDKEGLTIAASNWQEEHPFVGRNFSYRPYFQQAMKGRLGRYFALGTTSIKRGYYFAFPVRRRDEILGAVVIKINIDTVEKKWGYHDETFMVTDPENVIFLTTNPQWRFKTFGEIDPRTREMVIKSRRYPNSTLEQLRIEDIKRYDFGSVINIKGADGRYKTFLQQVKHMSEAGWDVRILSNIYPIRKKIIEVDIMVGAAFLLSYMLLVLLVQRRQRLAELKLFEDQARRVLQEANEKLETRVAERTSELMETNKKLVKEVQERKQTEAVLKKTRSELVQAAKMATLGQLSAGINHELNQPLSAIRSYADNSRLFLEKGRLEEAAWNLEQISELTDRMAQIGAQLKVFSRKAGGTIEVISVYGVIDGALEILAPSIRKHDVKITVSLQPENIAVMANQVLLQQVLVNLLSNAIQAVEGRDVRTIEITAQRDGGRVNLTIQDSGEGIFPQNLSKIFEPFFTTKPSGKGLGLGLTITERILHDMHGDISAEPSANGARFIFTLPAPQGEHGNRK